MRPALLACLLACAPVSAFAADVTFQVTDAKGRAIADAVVSLVPLDTPAKVTPPVAPVEIMQQGQEFRPYVTPLVVGTAVSFPNRDTVQHHVYSLSEPKMFELPLYAGESKQAIVFDRPGVVALGCNIHDWMAAYIVVLATPWFAQTGAGGTAVVSAVPAGRYRAEVWQPRLARTESRSVTVSTQPAAPISFKLALKPDRRVRRAPEADSGGYK